MKILVTAVALSLLLQLIHLLPEVVSHLVGDEGLGIAQDLGVELDVA